VGKKSSVLKAQQEAPVSHILEKGALSVRSDGHDVRSVYSRRSSQVDKEEGCQIRSETRKGPNSCHPLTQENVVVVVEKVQWRES